MDECVAIIRRPTFGVMDRGVVGLTFDAYISEKEAAQQGLSVEKAVEAIRDADVADVSDLEGRPCWVETDGSIIRYLRMWKR